MAIQKHKITDFVKPLNTILRKNKPKWNNDDWYYIMSHFKAIIVRLNEIETRDENKNSSSEDTTKRKINKVV